MPFCYNNIIHGKFAPEAQLSICLLIRYDKMKTATGKVSGTSNAKIEKECASLQEKYSCITRAAVNENVCEDSHTEHV